MSKPEVIKIDDVEYVRKDSISQRNFSGEAINHGLSIVIADRGFVHIGMVTTTKDWCLVDNARNIRIWGTTRGLGELINGPTTRTQLDNRGNISIPMKAVIEIIPVKESVWKGKF